MELKVKRTQSGIALDGSVPAEIAGAESVEIFPLRDGTYLMAVKGAIGRARASVAPAALSGEEKALLKKLLAIRFERRTPDEVERALSAKERAMLGALLEKKAVTVFRSKKYPKGVYNVSDAVYGQARDGEAGRQAAGSAHSSSGAATQAPAHDPLAKGFLVLESEGEARQLSGAVAERIKAGEVAGLRAFDRKYYFIKKAFAQQWQPKVLAALEKNDKTAEELSRELKLDAEGCRALLLHMGEEGELLEKSKGKFALA